ncbi:hypothetical protein QYH69_24295 [Paraburkholderia sp. SARCC-3016]|uniref:hypothetical protein n=1 Tax=Paraburkholderia sp. SARCC-3016 TaxID=3058611 RepID=UPI002809AABD|nr:hypothetical protein [Paraburkholderia sp. SARCC-3016]MDQ7980363.1 hypothetical protein [Paraburkholderia sp. SARCC-3016]
MNSPLETLPASLIVLTTDGRVQFGWLDPQTGCMHSEADGRAIENVAGSMEWAADRAH